MKDKKRYFLIGFVVVILMILIVFFVGRSFGFFKYIKEGETVNVITINGIKVDILDEEAANVALNLENAYPMSDSEGLAQTPFEFKMTNTSSRSLSYSIKIISDTDKLANCTLSDGTSCPELSTDYIKYSYKKDDGTYTEPALLSSNSNTVASDTISGNESITSSIILWIDSEAGNEIMNHYFFGKVIITGEIIS